jgi:hypothetical protein
MAGRWRLWILAALLSGAVAVITWLNLGTSRKNSRQQPQGFPNPTYSESRFLNAGPEAQFVGIETCASCHRSNHSSYLLTAHSRALSDLDPQKEPPDGSFHHQASGRSYRVYRRGTEFRHEEVLRTADGQEVARLDLPIRYLIGSGHFCRSYLVEVDGFLHESPITWYTSRQKWDMSPGYDFAQHWSFERPARLVCVACHAGRVEQAPDIMHLKIHELAIGCESCHGPGQRHAEYHRTQKNHPPGEEDLTIVNPGRLSRPLLEAVCAACHLNGPATIALRGRKDNDYRPGRPLTDYRMDYRFDGGTEQMTVVGHIEQLRRSACYQKSGTLTCITCHDPHAKERPRDPTAFYRQKCLDCHTLQACRLEPAQRLKKEAQDNCAACHMPRGDTDIPHIAFTHHRIDRHPQPPAVAAERIPELVPMEDVSHLPLIDRQRSLGLAYVLVSEDAKQAKNSEVFAERARALLEPLVESGLRDGATSRALAKIYWKKDPKRAAVFAQQAIEARDLPPDLRAGALVIRADCYSQSGDLAAAISVLEELVRLRRHSEDYRLLGRLYLELYESQKARQALLQALALRPYRYDIHGALGEAYRQLGDAPRAREHFDKARWLYEHRQE